NPGLCGSAGAAPPHPAPAKLGFASLSLRNPLPVGARGSNSSTIPAPNRWGRRAPESGAVAQHPRLHRIDESPSVTTRSDVLAVRAVVPADQQIGIAGMKHRRVAAQANLLHLQDLAVLADKAPDDGARQRPQEVEPTHREINHVVHLDLAVGE